MKWRKTLSVFEELNSMKQKWLGSMPCFSTLMVNSVAGEAVSNETSRHTQIGILDKHKWLPLWGLASSRLAVALGGCFIFLSACFILEVSAHLFALAFIYSHAHLSSRSEIEFKFRDVASTALQQQRKHTHTLKSPFKNHPRMELNYSKYIRGRFLIKTPIEFFMNLYFTAHLRQWVAKILETFYLDTSDTIILPPVACVAFIRPVIICSLEHRQITCYRQE